MFRSLGALSIEGQKVHQRVITDEGGQRQPNRAWDSIARDGVMRDDDLMTRNAFNVYRLSSSRHSQR